ncbi:PHD-finger domain-containing protein [Phthorimaea operculella]|nr:PHD-finger domain-containing protein [Phthorimaea operculella]
MRTQVDTLRSVTPVDTPLQIFPSEHGTGSSSSSALAASVFGIRGVVQQFQYFPLNTVLAAPPPPPSPPPSSESEEWSSSSSEDEDTSRHAKRKKLTKTKRSSQAEASCKEEPKEDEKVELCRVCKLRLEANRKYTHERFLVCSQCKANFHPGCVALGADTIRKAREYSWQCAECKRCGACDNPQDDNKMLFCDLCDRGFHIYCVRLDAVPQGRWHCIECAVCKSCGAKEPGGPPEAASPGGSTEEIIWHHQTKRGPGGHKVYSHSLCTPCARAYRIGRYCPLCDRSFIGPKGTMQLVICKLCDRQHHQECVKQTVSLLNVLDYTCAECRRGGITSRSAAARLAPRTIATLFMAKRRFNKYAHRQYMQSRLKKEEESAAEESVDVADESVDAADDESRDVAPAVVAADDASDTTDVGDLADVSDPLEGAGEPLDAAEPPETSESPVDETEAAVAALKMDFGD